MSAVPKPVRDLDPIDRAALRRELARWGEWMDRRDAFNGYPSMDTTMRAREGAGGGQPGHRVLMLDMPAAVYATHKRVLRLPEDLRALMYATHTRIMTDSGDVLGFEQRVARAGLTERTARRMYSRALLLIAGIEP